MYEAPSQPGVIWLGGHKGLYRFDVATETFLSYLPDPSNQRVCAMCV